MKWPIQNWPQPALYERGGESCDSYKVQYLGHVTVVTGNGQTRTGVSSTRGHWQLLRFTLNLNNTRTLAAGIP